MRYLQVSKKLATLLFPRSCTSVLRVPLSKIMEARGEVVSMGSEAVLESIIVVASSRKISFISASGADGAVYFLPDPSHRIGAVTCIAASSHADGEFQLYYSP